MQPAILAASDASLPVIEGFPLSAQQQRAWAFLAYAATRRASLVMTVAGPLERRALESALDLVVARHEILRTTFQALPGMQMPLQVVEPDGRQCISVVDVDVRSGDAVREQESIARDQQLIDRVIDRLIAADAASPPDLSKGPVLRCAVIARPAERHAIVLTLPSLCADHRTLQNLAGELTTAYAELTRRVTHVAAEPLQYVDFSEWQREAPPAASSTAQRFWERQRAASAVVPVPFVSPDEYTAQAFHPFTVTREIDRPRVARIRALAARHRASDAAFWMTCWSFLLQRLTRRTDLVIGRVFQGRRHSEMQTAMGAFAKPLPIRCRGAWRTAFVEQLAEIHRTMSDADEWQDAYDASPDATEWPLMFEYRPRAAAHQAGETTFTIVRQTCHAEPFQLKLTCDFGDDGLRIAIHSDAARVPSGAPFWMVEQLERVADLALDHPEIGVGEMDLLTDAQHAALAARNRTSHVFAGAYRPLSAHVEAQTVVTPDAIAVRAAGESVTYLALNRYANGLARELRARGVRAETRVAVLVRHSPRLLAALLAVMKAGGAYVPLDRADPAGRIAACLDDAEIEIGIVDAGIEPPPASRVTWLRVSDPAAWPADADVDAENEANLPTAIDGDHLAYVIYTSGSTGRPKGTLITQRGLMNYLLWCVERYGVTSATNMPLYSSVAVDLTVTSLFAPLIVGGTVTLAADVVASEALANVLQAGVHFDIVKLTPSHLQALAWQISPADLAARTDALIVGGEALHAEALQAWRTAAPQLRVFNEYGPTETVVGSCVHDVDEVRRPAPPGPVPIGRPIANTQLYVLDPSLTPVPPGLPGELFIGGAGVARGYLNRPDLTAQRFVPDPFGGHPGARMYRTGDTVRDDDEGRHVYVGRVDQQVKLRGHRIELGEIEAVLRTLPDVRDAAAVVHQDRSEDQKEPARQDRPGAARLVAYLAASEAARVPIDVLRATLSRTLPEAMLPDLVVWLDALPLTPGGKVDRRALPPPADGQGGARELVRAATEVEEVLAAIWADVLGLEEVGVQDNFFVLGGDSIRAIQVRARGRERGLDISHEQIFEHQTIAALARAVGLTGRAASPAPMIARFASIADEDRTRLPEDVEDAYPLAALQAGMVFHSEYALDSAVFHDIHSFLLRARPVIDLLHQAVADVTRRHPMLRTSFELARYSRPLQVVHRDVTPPLGITDLRALDADEQTRAVETWLDEERHRPFDWRRPPLLRFHVHILGEEAFQFTLSFHHAMLDGWSAASLLTELFNRYAALQQQRDLPPDPPLRCGFRDFVALEQQAETSEVTQHFWREALRSTSPTRLSRPGADLVRTRIDRIGVVPIAIAPETVDGLRRVARELALPLKSVILAAHAKVLAIENDQSRVLTGLVSNGRPEDIDGDRVLGLFLNTVPCVLSTEARSWRDLACHAFESERRLLPFRRYPLARLQREHGQGPLFDVAFNFMHYHVYRGVRTSAASGSMQVDRYSGYEETDVPLMANFGLDPQSGDLTLLLAYHPETFTQEDVVRIAGRYRTALAVMAADPDAPHVATDLLTSEERETIVHTWALRATPAWQPVDATSIVDALAARAAAAPDAIAIACGGASLSYGELHARGDRLAAHLRTLGVAADVPVAICVNRSPELIVGVLGILKAGGAYVPLDPTYPALRHALVLDDARPPVIVTEASLAERCSTRDAAIVTLDRDLPAQANGEGLPDVRAGHLAYVMYTSGSTGRPKGVMVPHGAVVDFMSSVDQRIGDIREASWLAVTSIAFDISVVEVLWTLARGARVVLLPSTQTELSTSDLIANEGITHLQCTPSWAWRLLAEPDAPRALGRLEHLLVGGEALPPTLAAQLHAHMRGHLHNMYGPTETTIWSSCERVDEPETITLGRPLPNSQLHIVDRAWHLVACGRAGEIVIGGDGTARGYLGRPDLTAERFVPDPFAAEPGARMYRTGDWGRLRRDGRVEFAGRRDGQVKLRGHRIELTEIEAALRTLPDVRDAAVMLREDAGDPRLVGYAVSTSGQPLLSDVVRQQLRERLPEAMVPGLIVSLEALPLTPNGKIDRHRLPAPTGARPDLTQRYVPPSTALEIALARIWSEVLRVESVGIHDNFFALGGHSLSATQVIARVRDACGVDLPLRPLFDAPTIAQLAPIFEAHRTARNGGGAEGADGAEGAEGGGRVASASDVPPTDAAPDIDALIDQLERLPDDEVRALLRGLE